MDVSGSRGGGYAPGTIEAKVTESAGEAKMTESAGEATMTESAWKAFALKCKSKLIERKHPDYCMRYEKGEVNVFFDENVHTWIQSIQTNSDRETLGRLLEKLRLKVFDKWTNSFPQDSLDSDEFASFWSQQVEKIKTLLKQKRKEKIKLSLLPPHVISKYIDLTDDSIPSNNELKNLKKSWKKEQKRDDEIAEINVKRSLSIEDNEKLLSLYSSKLDYWRNFHNQIDVITDINNRITEIKNRIDQSKKPPKQISSKGSKIQEWEKELIKYKNKDLTFTTLSPLMDLCTTISKELAITEEGHKTKDQTRLLDIVSYLVSNIKQTTELYNELLDSLSSGRAKGIRFPEVVCIEYTIKITSEFCISFEADSILYFYFNIVRKLKEKANNFAISLDKTKCGKEIEALISREVNEYIKEILADGECKEFINNNKKTLVSNFTAEFNQALKQVVKK
ncbi:MAG: hypothetical protein S4CHLAM20_15280 [Chlamydiia bacterium]|nr:hypothetical protein [Chlamydiia bacterium]